MQKVSLVVIMSSREKACLNGKPLYRSSSYYTLGVLLIYIMRKVTFTAFEGYMCLHFVRVKRSHFVNNNNDNNNNNNENENLFIRTRSTCMYRFTKEKKRQIESTTLYKHRLQVRTL